MIQQSLKVTEEKNYRMKATLKEVTTAKNTLRNMQHELERSSKRRVSFKRSKNIDKELSIITEKQKRSNKSIISNPEKKLGQIDKQKLKIGKPKKKKKHNLHT